LHAVHGCALLLVGRLSLQVFKLAIAVEILIGVWIHALNVWSGIFDAAIAAEPPEDVKLPRSCGLIGFHIGQSLLCC